ncbi:unnamed protein product [Rangifer tarandus platyrhynchus]|uniref:Uncharacterized protein n=1 Tax=Rangifer tarandus platyrhynchus TaxID=3082113 RepID=A0ABN8Y8Y6_RANTA|nr:unnamed protein product [Rangifer tarandus platyrhynchus]
MLCFIRPALLISAGVSTIRESSQSLLGDGGRSPSPSTGPKPVGGAVAEARYPEPSQGPLTPQFLHQQCPRDASTEEDKVRATSWKPSTPVISANLQGQT